MNEYDAEDEALAASHEEYLLQQTLLFIKADKNVSSKDLAAALRCDRVPIPKEILHYAADRLDDTPKKRGKPIDVTLESARVAFSDRDFLAEEIKAKYEAMKKNGLGKYEIYGKLADEYSKSEDWVSSIIYPRHKK